MADITSVEKKAAYDVVYGKVHRAEKSAQNKEHYESVRKRQFRKDPRQYLWLVARARSRRFGAEFSITPEDIVIPDSCPITGHRLVKADGYNPDAMSLDRVDNNKGYIKGNIRVISRWANLKKSSLSIEQLELLVQYMKGEI